MPALSFSFSKKAEPKKVVEALRTKPNPDEGKQAITSLEAGEVQVDGVQEAAKALTIPCKNPLSDRSQAKEPDAKRPKPSPAKLDEEKGGLQVRRLEQLSAEDAEAMKELLKDASQEEGGAPAVSAGRDIAPILMREGSKKAREGGDAADISRDTFERLPVESFGEALLRGMGYDPEKHTTKPVYHEKKRDGLLGLGAKALLPSEKIGKAGKAAAKKKASPDTTAAAAEPKAAEPKAAPETIDLSETCDLWPSRGLVVRVIGQGAELKAFFGAEAVVLEVNSASSCCKIKARPCDGGKSQVLQGIKLADIETRVSRDCKVVRIVRGPRKGEVAKLLQRDTKKGVAEVEFQGVSETLPLDDVCQFMG